MKPAPAGRPPRGGPGETQPKSSPRERVTITRDWEAVPVRWAQKDSSSGSPGGRKNTEQPAVCRGRWDPWRDLAFLCSWDPKMEMFADAAWGWRRGRSKEQHVSSPEAGGVRRACRKQEGKRGRGGGREGGTHLKPSTGSQGHLHSLPPAAPHAVNLSTPLPTQGHNQSLLRPARSPLLVGLFPRHADNAGSQ